eukprot:6203483-Pleurochrysis_carterae.AAC.2
MAIRLSLSLYPSVNLPLVLFQASTLLALSVPCACVPCTACARRKRDSGPRRRCGVQITLARARPTKPTHVRAARSNARMCACACCCAFAAPRR